MADLMIEPRPELSSRVEAMEKPAEQSRSQPRRRRLFFNQFIKLVRRSHLYAGLFLTPWVFLYGITGFLFNHPSVLSDLTTHHFDSSDLRDSVIDRVPDAETLAKKVLEQINQNTGKGYTLVRPESARFTRPFTVLLGNGRENYQISYDLNRRSGTVRPQPVRIVRPDDTAPNADLPTQLTLDSIQTANIDQGFAAILTKFGIDTSELKSVTNTAPMGVANGRPERSRPGRSDENHSETEPQKSQNHSDSNRPTPKPDTTRPLRETRPAGFMPGGGPGGRGIQPGTEVEFTMQSPDQKIFTVAYNIQTGQLNSREKPSTSVGSAGESLSTRRFFLRLHTTHGFPGEFNARWLWAVAVDLMSIAMVGWGLTGLVMWYHMKHLRRIGGYVLVLSLIVSIAMMIGMHSEIATLGR